MTETRSPARSPWLRFGWHYVEMIVAMFVGMAVLGVLFDVAGVGPTHAHHPEAAYLLMAFNMSVGMAVAMRLRRHSWRSTLEMCGAMFAPVVPLFPLLWLDAISTDTLMLAAHVLMFPLMLAVMFLRRTEYLHHAH